MADDHVCCGCHEEELITDANFRLAGKDMEIAGLRERVEALEKALREGLEVFQPRSCDHDACGCENCEREREWLAAARKLLEGK